MSLAGDASPDTPTLARALALAFVNDVLPIAASGNTGTAGNRPAVPGGRARRRSRRARHRPLGGRHRSRTAGRPTSPRTTSTSSIAAPGASDDCRFGVLSTLPVVHRHRVGHPRSRAPAPRSSSRRAASATPTGRAPASRPRSSSGIAALTWQVEPRLASEQVAEVLIRSAARRWAAAGTSTRAPVWSTARRPPTLARTYDVTSPRAKGSARPQRRARDRARQAGQGPQRVGARGGRARELRAAGVARRAAATTA